MRLRLAGLAVLAAALLLPSPAAFAQTAGYGGWPYGNGGPGGFGIGGPGGPFFGPAAGFLNNVSQVCTDSQGNRVFVTNGNATAGYSNCVPVQGPGGGAGTLTVALSSTGLGGTAVNGSLSLSQPTNGAFTVSGTLNGVTAGQTVTLNLPLTSGTVPLTLTAPGATVTVNNAVNGTPAVGGVVTVTESNLAGTVAQGTLAAVGNSAGLAAPQLCTDSQGNEVFVRSGNSTSGYTNCSAISRAGFNEGERGPRRRWGAYGGMEWPGFGAPPQQVCLDSQGNTVLVRSGSSSAGYTSCRTQ